MNHYASSIIIHHNSLLFQKNHYFSIYTGVAIWNNFWENYNQKNCRKNFFWMSLIGSFWSLEKEDQIGWSFPYCLRQWPTSVWMLGFGLDGLGSVEWCEALNPWQDFGNLGGWLSQVYDLTCWIHWATELVQETRETTYKKHVFSMFVPTW